MKRSSFPVLLALIMIGLAAMLSACSGSSSSGGSTAPQGAVNLSLVDAPGDFDHVYITVTEAWFHTSDVASPSAAGWVKFPLAAPVTVDLLALTNGNMRPVWSSIQLPVGTYKQIRLFLAPTYDSALPANTYHNYVVSGATIYPLYVPDYNHGIQLVGSFVITRGGTLKLAIDFNAGEDIVELNEGTDYVLKPRLNCFDLDHAGAIVGKLSTGGTFTAAPNFVIKAERLDSDGTNTFHVIRRWTVPNPNDGSFILAPVSTLVTSTWDIVIRGLNYKTVIIKGVPITQGATPASGATNLGIIPMTASSGQDYAVAGTISQPTGAWVQFYQTLQAPGEYPYEIRFRHFNPLWGGFRQTFMLNNDQIQVGNYVSSGVVSTLTNTVPVEGIGGYGAVADAILYSRSTPTVVSAATVTVSFPTPLTVVSPYQGNEVTSAISLGITTMMNAKMIGKMDSGLLFAVHGGMIVDAMRVDNLMGNGGNYTMPNLPGGTSGTPLPGAFYGIDAFGWSSTNALYKSIAIPQIVDLRTGNDTAPMDMLPLW